MNEKTTVQVTHEPILKQFLVQVYTYNAAPSTVDYDDEIQATEVARRAFTRSGVYKVKVWDTKKGPVIRNLPGAAGLIMELS